MKTSVINLLSESIDYAALNSSLNIDMMDALKEYVEITNSDDSWMLSKFVIPFHLIPELKNFADKRDRLKGPFNLCVVGPTVDSLDEFKNTVLTIEKDIMSAHSGFPGEVRTNVLELTLPTSSVENFNPMELVKAIEAVVINSADSNLLPHRVYFEIPGDKIDVDIAKNIIKVIAVHNKSVLKRKIDNYLFSGLKINCTPTPDVQGLAEIMLFARDANVAIKFSGQDIPTFSKVDANTNQKEFGLINVFMAGLLAYSQDLTTEETVEVLDDQNINNFTFKDNFIAWRELAAPVLEIKMLRMLSITSFNLSNLHQSIKSLKDQSIL